MKEIGFILTRPSLSFYIEILKKGTKTHFGKKEKKLQELQANFWVKRAYAYFLVHNVDHYAKICITILQQTKKECPLLTLPSVVHKIICG